MSSFAKGLFFAIAAYLVWGFLPLYWRLLAAISPMHVLAFRILFSLITVSLALVLSKNYDWYKFYKNRQTRNSMIFISLLISANWGLYIWAVNNGYTIEAALGYYINPLISIVLGLCVFKEKLKLLQIISFFIALTGVTVLTILTGRLPWISICLSLSFSVYGLFKKTVNLSALESLGAETLFAAPLGLFLLFTTFNAGQGMHFPNIQSLVNLTTLPHITIFVLILCGAATSFPLYLFAKATKLLPLSTLGFIQFLSPTMTFLTGIFIFREPFPVRNFIAVGFIWVAAILYIISLRLMPKQINDKEP